MFDVRKLRHRRQELGFSQHTLGQLIGKDQAYISRLEQGKFTGIHTTTLEHLAAALEITIGDLYVSQTCLIPIK